VAKPHVLLRGLDRICVITLLEFTKPNIDPPASRNLQLSCQLLSKS